MIINLEPNYETHKAYHSGGAFSDYHVRRAAYWSLLATPSAGVTYGNNATWWWGEVPEVPLNHEALGVVPPWWEGLDLPGAEQMAVLRGIFGGLAWWRLRPAPGLLARQPGDDDPRRFIAAAASEDGDLAVLYLPLGGRVALSSEAALTARAARRVDPRTGEAGAVETLASGATLAAPAGSDCLFVLTPS